MNELTVLLRAALEDQSRNVLTIDQVKAWLKRYRELHGEELETFPQEAKAPHWDLVAADYDCDKDAMFLLAFFKNGSVTFLAGRGSAENVRNFGLNRFPSNPEMVLGDIAASFWTAGQVTIGYDNLINWLNS